MREFVVMWATAAVWLSALVDWRITVPLNQHGLILVKDEANLWQRILFSTLLAGVYSALNITLLALLEEYRKRREATHSPSAERPTRTV